MSHTDIILKSFRKHPKNIIYENESGDNVKILSKDDEFYNNNTDSLINLAGSLMINFNEIKIGKDRSFFWDGTINEDIKWIFSIGGSAGDGFFLTMNLQKVDQALFEGLRKIVTFFDGQFKTEVIKKLHNNSF